MDGTDFTSITACYICFKELYDQVLDSSKSGTPLKNSLRQIKIRDPSKHFSVQIQQ